MRPAEAPLICPVCSAPLKKTADGRSFSCPEKHSFDLSSEGYLNLLLTGKGRSSHPGDDKEMIRARRDFLRAGYYGILRDALREATAGGGLLLDCGCGEGYYTAEMAKGRSGAIGIDVAKEAVRLASKADGDTLYLVASSFALPLESGSVDRATCIFTPVADNEIARVLSPGGKMTVVLPGKRHLWEMKEALYADPYENSGEAREYPAFLPPAVTRVGGGIELPPEAVRSLFLMTPYSRKTSPGAVESLFSLEKLRTSIEFLICVYEKRG